MRRIIVILSSILIITIFLALFSYKNLPSILAKTISNATETPVKIESVNLEKNKIVISNLDIQNPKEAQSLEALKAKTISIESPYIRYLKNPINIDKIQIDNLYINIQIYNKDQTTGNWHTIIKNMEEESSSILSIERVAIIKKLILTNIQVDLILPNGETHHLSSIKLMEFDDVRSDKGVPIQEISDVIINKMIKSIFIKNGIKAIIKAPVNIIKGIIPFI